MKVLHCTPSYYPAFVYGGPIKSVYAIVNGLHALGVNQTVLTLDGNGPGRRLTAEEQERGRHAGTSINYCFHIGFCELSLEFLLRLPLEVLRADIVHITAAYSLTTPPAFLFARLFGRPVVFSPRGAFQSWEGSSRPRLKRMWRSLLRTMWHRDWVLHVTAENELRQSQNAVGANRSSLIPNGVSVVRGDRMIYHEEFGGRILFVGRLHHKKGIENLLGALAIVRKTYQISCQLKIVGDGDEAYVRRLRTLVERLSLKDCVVFDGQLDGESLERAYLWSDFVVVPSHVENFAMVVVEALASGRPVIASKGTPWERVTEVGCGLWVDNSESSLAAAIVDMSAMDLVRMGQLGREWISREFSWDQSCRRFLELYVNAVVRV